MTTETSLQPVAIVTGGSRGIGRAIAGDLARSHRVIATYRAREDAARSLQEEAGVEIFKVDIAQRQDREALLAFCLEKFGRLDLLVNNAGDGAPRAARSAGGLRGEFRRSPRRQPQGSRISSRKPAARWMQQSGSGRIVFITSISAYTSSPNRGEYCVSKAGLSMAVALFADRLAADGITVFEIRPGIIRTDMVAPRSRQIREVGRGRAAAPEPPRNPGGHRPSRAVHRRRPLGLRHRTSIRRRRRVPPSPPIGAVPNDDQCRIVRFSSAHVQFTCRLTLMLRCG